MFSFILGHCYGCGRYTTLKGRKKPKCYDCTTYGIGFVKKRMEEFNKQKAI